MVPKSLYHYTRDLETVEKIMMNGFRFSLLEEEIPVSGYQNCIFDQIEGLTYNYQSRRAVCFCDIPLSQAREHREQYGNYIIGLSKNWGMAKGATPVRYVHRNSPDIGSEKYQVLIDLNEEMPDVKSCIEQFARIKEVPIAELNQASPNTMRLIGGLAGQLVETIRWIGDSMGYIRLYEGDWVDRVTGHESIREFYREREWRILASDNDGDYVQFSAGDLRRVYVKDEDEKRQLVEKALKDCPMFGDVSDSKLQGVIQTFDEFLEY